MSNMDNLHSIVEQVCDLTREVGQYIAAQRDAFDREQAEFKGQNDLVSYVDRTAEGMLTARLGDILPAAGFITEEKTVEQTTARLRWIVDPLDGTTNFVHGIPAYSVSVALADEDQLLAGVVYEVTRNECFYAWKGAGAFLNGQEIRVSQANKLTDSLMLTGLPIKPFDRKMAYLEIIAELMTHTHGLRRIGSAAVDLAYVACGRAEGYFECNIQSWDVAAGALIVQEAGGMVTNFAGGLDFLNKGEIVAAGPTHPLLVEVIQKFWN